MRALITLLAALAVTGCSDSELRQMSDNELAGKYADCLDNRPTAPGKATACENMRRECERRREELGSFLCRTY
ncbi:hypothetical protein FKG94_07685 [Exilibacterium tricleocarpae]|uniref:Uncharacterized protein n=1 Tax=Exilibacterium tricleocarpae TaxID=2591008 RepID=A0A545TZG3_9GAMM|nr:hypothetical protein [Exilibacterium tricleocarpae]TQV82604.1 hypothetical protein FKG94_07685 [Exilibacterium tricleocarpae]